MWMEKGRSLDADGGGPGQGREDDKTGRVTSEGRVTSGGRVTSQGG